MKVALCFYGLVGSSTDKNGLGKALDPNIAYNLNKKNLMGSSDVDVFMHSWSEDHKDKLIELYKPKSYIIEKQISFQQSVNIANNRDFSEKIKNLLTRVKKPLKARELTNKNKAQAFRSYSRWYSNKKVIDLKSEYEKENNFKYDCVMVIRLDVGFYTKVNFRDYNMNYFHASHWNDYPTKENNYLWNKKNHYLGKGFLDFWFFSSSENMDSFSKLYDAIENYHISPHRASYEHVITFTKNIIYTKYRWLDFEMIRRKEFHAEK